MKLIVLSGLSACLLAAPGSAAAQECRIYYTYDKAGSRVQRSYTCDRRADPGQPAAPGDAGTRIRHVYPVPTSGVVHISFSQPLASAWLQWSDMNGTVLLERTIQQPVSAVSFDISAWIPAQYVLTLIAEGDMESVMVTKY